MTSAKRLASKVEDFKDDLGDNLDDALERGMRSTTAKAHSIARRKDLDVNTNPSKPGLIDSIHFENSADTTFVNASKDVLSSARTVVGASYSPFIEYGTGTHGQPTPDGTVFKSPDPAPPIGKMRQWVIARGLTIDVSMRTVDRIKNQQRLAWIMREIIGTKGNRAYPFARPAARRGFDDTVDNAERAMSKSLRRF